MKRKSLQVWKSRVAAFLYLFYRAVTAYSLYAGFYTDSHTTPSPLNVKLQSH